MKIEENDLKELLIMFKKEQDYAERKNQIIFVVLGILATIFATIIDKVSTIQLYVLIAAFISIALIVLGGFFPQGRFVKTFYSIVPKFMKQHSKKKNKGSNNYLNYINWKNFEVTKKNDETKKAMNFFKIPINEKNINICEQILITSKIIYLKYKYFQWACVLIGVWTIVVILVFTL